MKKKLKRKRLPSMRRILACAIPGCSNKSDLGEFVGSFCAPCYYYIIGKSTGSDINPSQAYRNELFKNNLRSISAVDERRRYVKSLMICGHPQIVHESLEDVRLLMTAVLNDEIDVLEMWNKHLFVARKYSTRVAASHRQDFGGPLGG